MIRAGTWTFMLIAVIAVYRSAALADGTAPLEVLGLRINYEVPERLCGVDPTRYESDAYVWEINQESLNRDPQPYELVAVIMDCPTLEANRQNGDSAVFYDGSYLVLVAVAKQNGSVLRIEGPADAYLDERERALPVLVVPSLYAELREGLTLRGSEDRVMFADKAFFDHYAVGRRLGQLTWVTFDPSIPTRSYVATESVINGHVFMVSALAVGTTEETVNALAYFTEWLMSDLASRNTAP